MERFDRILGGSILGAVVAIAGFIMWAPFIVGDASYAEAGDARWIIVAVLTMAGLGGLAGYASGEYYDDDK